MNAKTPTSPTEKRRTSWSSSLGGLGVLAFTFVFLAGCQSAHVGQPLAAALAKDSAENRLEFWHRLSDAPVTSNDDAFHALLLYFDGKDDAGDYAGRVE